MVAIMAVNMAFLIVLERASMGFKPLKPQLASVYDPYFWSHERYWKLLAQPILAMVAGTPFRGMLLRALGMKVGAKLFDGGAGLSTGDDVVIDADSFLMKGEILDSCTGWCGNPAKLVRRQEAQAEVCIQRVADTTDQNERSLR